MIVTLPAAGPPQCRYSPSLPSLKRLDFGDFQRAWGGIASLQFGLPIVWTAAQARGGSLSDVAQWMCSGPADFLNLDHRKGTIEVGKDADLVVWNPETSFTVAPSLVQHRHHLTPYEGQSLKGIVEKTFLRGVKVYEDGQFLGTPVGRAIVRS